MLQIFNDRFEIDEIKNNNILRAENFILIRCPEIDLYFNVSTKEWSNPNYAQLIPKGIPLKMCQPKQFVFRETYLGYYLNSFQVFDLTTSDLKFLFPEYEFIVEQAMKLNLPFIYTAFRKECNEFIKNMNTTSLTKATEMSAKQLTIFQNKVMLLKNDILYYFLRLGMLISSCKGIQLELFEKICDIALNDKVSNQDLEVYNTLILSKPGNITSKINKINNYINSNFFEYHKLWNTLKDINQLDLSEFPELPKINIIEDKIQEMQTKIIMYEDEALYSNLNSKYKEFISKLKQYEYFENKYCIICPQVIQELDIEGNILHHCVGSYKHNVAEGKEIILFLRKTDDSKTPFYTIDLDTDGYIRQIHTRYNGDIEEDPEKEDIKTFLINWANAKSNLVNKKSIKLNYGALTAKE